MFRTTARSLAHSPIETPYAALNSLLTTSRLFAAARPNGFCYDDPLRQEASVKRGQHRHRMLIAKDLDQLSG
jgi:hypothetical protein